MLRQLITSVRASYELLSELRAGKDGLQFDDDAAVIFADYAAEGALGLIVLPMRAAPVATGETLNQELLVVTRSFWCGEEETPAVPVLEPSPSKPSPQNGEGLWTVRRDLPGA